MKQVALIEHEGNSSLFTPAELVLLSELGGDLKDDGVVMEKHIKLRTLPNVRFAFLSFARAHHIDLTLDFSGSEWVAVRRAFEVRGKLMHPRVVDDLEISETDARTVRMAGEWVHESFLGLMRQTPVKDRVAAMKQKLVEEPEPAV